MPIMKKFDIQPRIPGDVTIGGDQGRSLIIAGRMSEKGSQDTIYFDASGEFVTLQVGKRGSGKSYGMGSILEGFAMGPDSSIAKHEEPRAVVLLDPLDIHWPALIPLSDSGTDTLKQQYSVWSDWEGLTPEPISVQVFLPAGFDLPIDRPDFTPYRIPVRELAPDDWALLLQTNLITEPRGRLLDEAFRKVTEFGWATSENGATHGSKADYAIEDLIACIEGDHEITALYHQETIRSVVQPLRSFGRMDLFADSAGTPMIEIARAGTLSILSLGRLGEDLRTVVATVFVRKLQADRSYASQISRRLALSSESAEIRQNLRDELAKHVPRTILAIDEAQILMPARTNSTARKALDSFVLEGRNCGLSLWLATQRPKGAISEAAISQIDTFIIHKLSISEDVKTVCGMLQNRIPEKIRLNSKELSLDDMIRSLDKGQAVISSATSTAQRIVIGQIRPRVVAHGGEAF
jgi:uncharacterized protein